MRLSLRSSILLLFLLSALCYLGVQLLGPPKPIKIFYVGPNLYEFNNELGTGFEIAQTLLSSGSVFEKDEALRPIHLYIDGNPRIDDSLMPIYFSIARRIGHPIQIHQKGKLYSLNIPIDEGRRNFFLDMNFTLMGHRVEGFQLNKRKYFSYQALLNAFNKEYVQKNKHHVAYLRLFYFKDHLLSELLPVLIHLNNAKVNYFIGGYIPKPALRGLQRPCITESENLQYRKIVHKSNHEALNNPECDYDRYLR